MFCLCNYYNFLLSHYHPFAVDYKCSFACFLSISLGLRFLFIFFGFIEIDMKSFLFFTIRAKPHQS